MASGAGGTDAATGRRGRSPSSAPPIAAPQRGGSGEQTVARMHASGRRLVLPAVVLVAVAGAYGWLIGRAATTPEALALTGAALLVVLLAVIVPYLAWLTRRYTVTTRRVIVRSGLLVHRRQEVLLTRGFAVTLRRGPLQRLAGSGDVVLDTGGDAPVVLGDVPSAVLVQAALADLVELSTAPPGTRRSQQIAATRRPFDP